MQWTLHIYTILTGRTTIRQRGIWGEHILKLSAEYGHRALLDNYVNPAEYPVYPCRSGVGKNTFYDFPHAVNE